MLRRKFFILSALVIILIITAGCSLNNKQANPATTRGNNLNGQASTTADRFADLPKASSSDLIIGEKVMVMGTKNTDGTISASSIIIGEMNFLGNGTSSRNTFASGTNPGFNGDNQGNGFTGQRNGSGRTGSFNGQNSSGQRPVAVNQARVANQANVNGEILKKDESSLVIKSADGGSQIVFYSDKTMIYFTPPPTQSPTSSSTPLK